MKTTLLFILHFVFLDALRFFCYLVLITIFARCFCQRGGMEVEVVVVASAVYCKICVWIWLRYGLYEQGVTNQPGWWGAVQKHIFYAPG